MIIKKFSKYLTNIEYPKEKTSWNIAGILKGQNAHYKFDVKDLIKESSKRGYRKGNLKSKADKMVFEFKDRWIILDMEELNKYVKNKKIKDMELNDLIPKLQWTMEVLK